MNDIDPLLEALSLSNLDQRTTQEEELASKGFLTVHFDDCVDENGEWIMEGDDNDSNSFDVIIDESGRRRQRQKQTLLMRVEGDDNDRNSFDVIIDESGRRRQRQRQF